ncbi:metalloregulator ArsR/SmtB family transcription factor [Gemmatimonas aurantiaca]|uniref:ArsR/SmtB family transcription factor n=1 Tax=Gemmatimonas aurantiaca TaxID=173480 RepID=UPI00301DBB9B
MLQHPDLDQLLHAIADPSRRAITERLSVGPAAVSELASPLRISLAAVLQHVQVLERAGIVRTRKVGRVRTCQLEPEAFRALEQWIAERRQHWEQRFDRLGALLDESPARSPNDPPHSPSEVRG